MKDNWFIKYGWIYLPVHIMGYLVSLAGILFMIPVSIAVIRNGHSVTDDLYHLFIYVSCVAFWWKWVAEKTSV